MMWAAFLAGALEVGGLKETHFVVSLSQLIFSNSFSMGRPQHAQKSPVPGRITAAPLDSM